MEGNHPQVCDWCCGILECEVQFRHTLLIWGLGFAGIYFLVQVGISFFLGLQHTPRLNEKSRNENAIVPLKVVVEDEYLFPSCDWRL